MEISYNPEKKRFDIKDNRRTLHLVLMIIMLMNILNGAIFYIGNPPPPFQALHYIWMVLLLASLTILYVFLFKKSTQSTLPLAQIRQVREKKVLGRKSIQVKLQNGRTRDLSQKKKESDHQALRKVFEDAGVRIY
jgi:hypothetical protein